MVYKKNIYNVPLSMMTNNKKLSHINNNYIINENKIKEVRYF